MKFALKVLPKPEVLDTQGRAVQSTMQDHGFPLQACTVGKYLVLDVESTDPQQAEEAAHAMAKKGLYNPLIENYELEKL